MPSDKPLSERVRYFVDTNSYGPPTEKTLGEWATAVAALERENAALLVYAREAIEAALAAIDETTTAGDASLAVEMLLYRCAPPPAPVAVDVEACPLCGHEWKRHDPEDGRCDAGPPHPFGSPTVVCACGRDLHWMLGRTAALSRAALPAAPAAAATEARHIPNVDFTLIPETLAGQWVVLRVGEPQEILGSGTTPRAAMDAAGNPAGDLIVLTSVPFNDPAPAATERARPSPLTTAEAAIEAAAKAVCERCARGEKVSDYLGTPMHWINPPLGSRCRAAAIRALLTRYDAARAAAGKGGTDGEAK